MGAKGNNLTGMLFGRLTVINRTTQDKAGTYFWLCRCICGKEKLVRGYSLKRGDTQSCGCLPKNRNVGFDRKYPTAEEASWAYNYSQYASNAKIRGIPFSLSFEQYKEICSKGCVYCDEPPETRPAQRGRSSICASGIDRVNNNLGYDITNVVPCCTWCNRTKSNFDVKDFIKRCERVILKANAGIARNS